MFFVISVLPDTNGNLLIKSIAIGEMILDFPRNFVSDDESIEDTEHAESFSMMQSLSLLETNQSYIPSQCNIFEKMLPQRQRAHATHISQKKITPSQKTTTNNSRHHRKRTWNNLTFANESNDGFRNENA